MALSVRRLRLWCLAPVAALACPSFAAAQAATARLEGTVHDSIHTRGARGAVVFLTRTKPSPPMYFSAVADARGQYHLDSLTAGEYSISFSTDVLDSLELTLPAQTVVIGEGEHARVDLATPSSATLKSGACPGIALQGGRGAVVGRVVRAETDSVVRGAIVAVNWQDLSVDRTTMRPVTTPYGGAVRTDSLGEYRMCGVPTDTHLLLQVQHEGRVMNAVGVIVPDTVGVVLRNFSFSTSGSHTIAELDSAKTDTVARLSGRASLTGVVRSPTGPLSDALVRVVDAATPATHTDSLGRFSLAGLPSGTQLLDVRHIGYLLTQVPVTLRDGASTVQDVSLTRIVSLDSIRVIARRTLYREFEDRAKYRRGFGKYLREADLEKRHALETSDFLRSEGFFVQGSGLDAKVISPRSMSSNLSGPCAANVVIDGIQHQDINLIPPQDIAAMEVYRGNAGAPIQYDSACGLIVIWTKR